VSLRLKPHDTAKIESAPPRAQVRAGTFLIGRHEQGIRIVYLTGNPGDKANKGYRIWYQVVPPRGERPPALNSCISLYNKRKKEVMGERC
jgi:hypothetical protein